MQLMEFQSKDAVAKPDVTGGELLTVVSYNIGAKTNKMCAKDREKFLTKLQNDFNAILGKASPQVICLQECAPVFLEHILSVARLHRCVEPPRASSSSGSCC